MNTIKTLRLRTTALLRRCLWPLVRLVPRSNCPTVFPVDELTHWRAEAEVRPGQWEPARPLGLQGVFLRHRLRVAWLVFRGEADAVRWIEPNNPVSHGLSEAKDVAL